ncbi:DUF7504 family protein [Halobacterium zhouii]|uniref:DUF7504 family protein n=1 Tax=Halobacterium zhouii TaxID=2902624 RepID=UPI001E5D26BD|nr:hypothetical protein [Halobacterium zhouii]
MGADVPRTPNSLGVTFGVDAEQWLGNWQAGADRVAVVSAGERSRTTASVAGGDDVVAELTGAVETVPETSDVSVVGELVNEYLVKWRGDGDTTVYVDDLTTLLDSVSAETAFRFVHALLARATATDARVVVSMDGDAHAPHVVGTFEALFEDVRR